VDVQNSIQYFVNWINSVSDEEIEIKYNQFLEKSKNNRKILFEYLNDYSQSEKIFQTLIN
jgi:late competence protein required for DNA uptake (superfamily II DNA/RNA helicase)